MRTSIKVLDEERHLSAQETAILQEALRSFKGSDLATIRSLIAATQNEQRLFAEAEQLSHNGDAGVAVHRYEGAILNTRGAIEHLIKQLDKELDSLEHLVRDLHRLDERIATRMVFLRNRAENDRKAA